jgi:two-component system, OmpR family, sensor kinase
LSIQNRLLLIYTLIFSAAFIIFALIIYFLPSSRILAEIDRDLETLASEVVRPGNFEMGPGGVVRVSIPENLVTLRTASTFLIITDANGEILARSGNLAGFDGLLDVNGLRNEPDFTLVNPENTSVRVYSQPIYLANDPAQTIVGHLQVGRLIDTYNSFNRLLAIAMLVGFAAATASLFLAVWLTPSLFRPLDDIAKTANGITRADDLSLRVPYGDRTDEIGVLARALNQTLERLERQFQTQQRLLADVSHELRTPLTAIRGNIDLMERMGEGDPLSLDSIRIEVDRMTRLVGDLTLLARADAGGLPLDKQPIELDNLLFEVYRQFSMIEKPVSVVITEVDQVCVLGDPDRLKQLFINLIDNAIKYTLDGGKVNISLSKLDGWAQFQVTDTGVGIPPEDLPHIFDRFYRVDKARNRAQGGSGLGLSIAKWVARAHGGNIQVKSEVGVGTTFTVSLPAVKPSQESRAADGDQNMKTKSNLRLPFRGKHETVK